MYIETKLFEVFTTDDDAISIEAIGVWISELSREKKSKYVE